MVMFGPLGEPEPWWWRPEYADPALWVRTIREVAEVSEDQEVLSWLAAEERHARISERMARGLHALATGGVTVEYLNALHRKIVEHEPPEPPPPVQS